MLQGSGWRRGMNFARQNLGGFVCWEEEKEISPHVSTNAMTKATAQSHHSRRSINAKFARARLC